MHGARNTFVNPEELSNEEIEQPKKKSSSGSANIIQKLTGTVEEVEVSEVKKLDKEEKD
jgi:hypothetical protein